MTAQTRTSAFMTGVVGLAMALAWSWVPHFWRDERATLRAARLPWGKLWPFLRNHDLVHGAYYAIMHPWLAEFGSSPFAARLPSAIAIALAVAGVTAIGAHLADRRTAVISGLVMALLPVTSHYGMEARSYALACAFAAWASYFLLRATDPGASRRWWLGYAVLLLAAGTVFIYALLIGLAHTVALALARRPVRIQLSILAVVGIVMSPLILLASQQSGQVSWISRVLVGNVVDTPFSWVISVPQPHGGFSHRATVLLHGNAILLGVMLWLLVGSALTRALRKPAESGDRKAELGVLSLAVPWLFLPAAVLISVSLIRPMFVERYVFFSAPAFALLIGYALAQLTRRTLIGVVVVLLLLAAPLWIADREPLSKSALGTAEKPAG